jgi:hypothetical protein
MQPPFPRAVLVFLMGVSLAVLSPQTALAQNAFVGTWDLVPDSISGHIPGLPAANELEIDLSGAELNLTRHPMPMLGGEVRRETYRLDGSETDLSEYRKGRLAAADSTMTLTTVRIRPGSEQLLIVSDVYQASENVLTVTRTMRSERPRGVLLDTPRNRWEARYRRIQ